MAADVDVAPVLNPILDAALDRIQGKDGIGAVAFLCQELTGCRLRAGEDAWRQRWCPHCRTHPLREAVHQDPYTWRAFAKPRGYAGDAVMLDYVYTGVPPDETSETGRVVFEGTTRTTNGLSVIDRRNRLSRWIDEESARLDRARIMSVACGHLREAAGSAAIAAKSVEVFHAMDQDAESLQVVARECPAELVRPIHAPLTQLLRNSLPVEPVDFIYAAGLFDYLPDRLAARTIERMFALLRPGGRLLVANFTPQSSGRAYMEAFMDWWLIYRTDADLESLAVELPQSEVHSRRRFEDQYGNIAYLDVRKAG